MKSLKNMTIGEIAGYWHDQWLKAIEDKQKTVIYYQNSISKILDRNNTERRKLEKKILLADKGRKKWRNKLNKEMMLSVKPTNDKWDLEKKFEEADLKRKKLWRAWIISAIIYIVGIAIMICLI